MLNNQLENQKNSNEQDKKKLASLERSLSRLQEGSQQALLINQRLQVQIQISKVGEERLELLIQEYEEKSVDIQSTAAEKTNELQMKLEEAEKKSKDYDKQYAKLNSELEKQKELNEKLRKQVELLQEPKYKTPDHITVSTTSSPIMK